MTVHHVFLSHSGRQKDFVEQLALDLERKGYSCFFDKDPRSLPKGEEFPSRILEAAHRCRVAVVLLTEDYFSNSKWPMLELAAFVDAKNSTSNPDLKILPLFYDISSKDIRDPLRMNAWLKKWKEWEGERGVDVEMWNQALHAIRAVNGLAFKKDMGQVHYRSEIVDAVGDLLRNMSEQCEYVLVGTSFTLYEDNSKEVEYHGELDAAYKTGILRRKTRASLVTFFKPLPLVPRTIMEGICWAFSSNVMAHGCLTGFFVNAQHMPQLIAKGLHFAQGGCMGETDPYSKSPLVKKFAWGKDFAYDGVCGDSVIAACFISKSNDPMENVGAADRYRRCVYLNIRYGNMISRAAVVSHLWKEAEVVLGYEETASVSLEGKKTFGDQILQSYAIDSHVSYYISCN